MPRSIWNGVISFGMVSIPVKLYTATENKDICFNLLHKECGDPNEAAALVPRRTSEPSSTDEIVRGYEYAKDQYVVVNEEDFEKLPLAQQAHHRADGVRQRRGDRPRSSTRRATTWSRTRRA